MSIQYLCVFMVMMGISSCFSTIPIKCFCYKLENGRTKNLGFFQSINKPNMRGFWFSDKVLTQARAIKKTKRNHVFNVDNFGAKGDGKTDDSLAFHKAWRKACSRKHSTLVVPPKKKYYLKPMNFNGRCKGVTMKIQGNMIASKVISDYIKDRHQWIKFNNVNDLKVLGGGTIDGNGKVWWIKSCKRDKRRPCKSAPTALVFSNCTNLKVKSLQVKNSQQMHLTFHSCENVVASNIIINSPEDSPNTDGIHVSQTKNILIDHCNIQTGDDCISIVNGSHQVNAQNIKCGPGHGISVGSLGENGHHDMVSNILVYNTSISNTENGVRIKTWQGGSGTAKDILFQNIYMQNVTNPIIIDQYYCDKNGKPCTEKTKAVQLKNVWYKNIKGTSARKESVVLKCSKKYPCKTIKFQNVDLLYKGKSSVATCKNVKPEEIGYVVPRCLK